MTTSQRSHETRQRLWLLLGSLAIVATLAVTSPDHLNELGQAFLGLAAMLRLDRAGPHDRNQNNR